MTKQDVSLFFSLIPNNAAPQSSIQVRNPPPSILNIAARVTDLKNCSKLSQSRWRTKTFLLCLSVRCSWFACLPHFSQQKTESVQHALLLASLSTQWVVNTSRIICPKEHSHMRRQDVPPRCHLLRFAFTGKQQQAAAAQLAQLGLWTRWKHLVAIVGSRMLA